MTPQEIALFAYNLSLVPIIFFSVLFILLSVVNLSLQGKAKAKYKPAKNLPFVSVQIPTFNDPIAARCVRRCMALDYPRDKYEIIIADDSTNRATQELLKEFANRNSGFIKYLHRANRDNFKAGALNNALNITKGEIIVIFDSDWMPKRDFLKRIIRPFSDPKVAIVQSGQGIYNRNSNLITRFAAYLMMIYHSIIMPINNRLNCVFFCGTSGAIRKSAFIRAGGWNLNSITEDSDLTVNLLLMGYKSVYLDFETPSEVPDTYEGFLKQQMRWCYGNARAFFDNASGILFKKGLGLRRRMMITYVTLGNVIAPIIVTMTLFGFAGWFLGELNLFTIHDFTKFALTFFYTSGFLFMGIIAMSRKNQLKELHFLLLSALTLGIVLSVANSIAFIRAVANKKLQWYCTPKKSNYDLIQNDDS